MKQLKIPIAPSVSHWQLSPRHKFFLDLTILTTHQHAELFGMVFKSQETPAQLQKKANAVYNSSDGKEYVEQRTEQLRRWYFPDEYPDVKEEAPERVKSVDEMLAESIPGVMRDLQRILEDRDDPNYQDAFKAIMSKLVKDIQTNKTAEAPKRYLPENCANCRFKLFCEQNCEDECEICNYKKYANEHGVEFDYKNQLSKPTEEEDE